MSPLRLLLIEDNPDDARLVERQLRPLREPFVTERVETKKELEEALVRGPVDAVISDYSLPGFSGLQALKIVHAHDEDIPFILVSGVIGEDAAVEAMRSGAHDYVMKGSLMRLVPALEREMQEAQSRRDRKAAIAAQLESEARFRAIVENCSDVLAIVSTDLIVRYESPSVERILGHRPEQLVGASMFLFVHPADQDRLRLAFDTTLHRSAHSVALEVHMQHSDGSWRSMHTTLYSLVGHPHINGVLLTARDITERNALQGQLERAERLAGLGRLASSVAHEFNNVLMGIQPFAEIVRRRGTTDPQVIAAADTILKSVSRGKRVTGDILRYTQETAPLTEEVDVARWLSDLTPDLRAIVGDAGELVVGYTSDNLHLNADPRLLAQVLSNLVTNARDAMQNRGLVTIAAREEIGPKIFPFGVIADQRPYVHLTVRDTGSGIPPEDLPRLFEPLFTTKSSRAGLGLAIAQKIVARHSGSIFVESTVGQGTTFHVLLPALEESARLAHDELAGERRASRILLVENDVTIAAGLASLLRSSENDVTVVCCGEEALATLSGTTYDVAVIDSSLPDVSGLEVFLRTREWHPSLPVVFSANDQDDAVFAAISDDPFVRCLRKPYDSTQLVGAIREVLAVPFGIEMPVLVN